MRFLRYLAWLLWDVLRYGVATRRLVLVLAVLLGIAVAGVVVFSTTVAPVLVYPFV